jgi:hypothetical protein
MCAKVLAGFWRKLAIIYCVYNTQVYVGKEMVAGIWGANLIGYEKIAKGS